MIRSHRSLACLAIVAIAALGARTAAADLAKWDQAKVTDLAKQLEAAAKDLNDTFYKQPPPSLGSMQSRSYQRLKQKVRMLRSEAGALASSLAKGEGLEETQPSYDSLMELVRAAREDARQVFTGYDVQQKATAMRGILNQLSPYYDPDAVPLQPVTR